MRKPITFSAWIKSLDEEVIQGEYGYEEGEFDVFPSHWRPLYDEGLTPHQAFRHALDAQAQARREEDRRRHENWLRIQSEDAVAILAPRQGSDDGR